MYFSGTWRGYWEQNWFGRQPMHDLVLHFRDGRVEGSGVDIVGRFTVSGSYDERGKVLLTKHYRSHRVYYRGTYDGEGTIHGTWIIPGYDDSGPFALTVSGHSVPADAPIISITADPPRPEGLGPKKKQTGAALSPSPAAPDADITAMSQASVTAPYYLVNSSSVVLYPNC
jgi:hypothetical protein